MFLTILLTVFSTIIIGAIVSLILYLISSFKSEEKQESPQFLADIQEKTLFNDELLNQNRGEEQLEPHFNQEKVTSEEKSSSQFNVELHIQEEKPELSEEISTNSSNEEQFEEISDEKFENKSKDNSELETFEKEIEKLVDEENEKLIDEENNSLRDLLEISDSQNLTHFNKSRPKKPKSRPSVKVVFSKDSEKILENLSGDSVTQNTMETVENVFETTDYGVEDENKKVDQKEELKIVIEETKFKTSFHDGSFEELSTGDYKKFDEFSDYFSLETKRQEFIRKCENKNQLDSSNQNKDETEDEDNKCVHQTNDEIVDELFGHFIEESKEEMKKSISITKLESFEITSEDSIKLSVRDYEKSSHNEKVKNFKLSLSKVLSSSDKNLSPSKSPLSATIESATKPLLSSPTLSRKSLSSLQLEQIEEQQKSKDHEKIIKRMKRISLPVFGLSQTPLIDELKEKQFQKSLKSQNSNSSSSQDYCDQNNEKVDN